MQHLPFSLSCDFLQIQKLMRFTPTYLCFVLISLFSCDTASDKTIDGIQNSIDEVKRQYVVDKRTSLFEVIIEKVNDRYIIKGETISPSAKKELLEKLEMGQLTFIDSIEVLPSANLNGQNYGVVTLSVCNIRSNPKHSAELATQATMGTLLRVYKKQGDFYLIQTPDNYLGWVDRGGFELMSIKSYYDWVDSERAICIEDFSFAYQSADKHAPKITDLLAGNIVKTIEKQGLFTKILLPDGRMGFMENAHLLPYQEWIESRKATPENILHSAAEFMGRPYLWGGTSGKGMDCSGFTKMVYYLNGIQLERDASLQVHTGQTVETDTTLKNLLPGDLLFFGNLRDDGSERITHVAIYMGGGKIIHASDRVKIESLIRGDEDFAENRLKTFMRAKRIIGSEGENGIIALKDSPFY